MKTFLKIIGIAILLIVLVCVWLIVWQYGILDTRFWKNDPDTYIDAANGIYRCPEDLSVGAYVLEIKSKLADGRVSIYANESAYNNYADHKTIWTTRGSDLRFSLEEGQVIEIHVNNPGKMHFKKES